MTLTKKTFPTETLYAKGDADRFPFRVLYANHVPVSEWTVWFGQTLNEVTKKARNQAARDLRPASGVYDNVFIIQRWTEDEGWDDYDEDGEDLTELAFDDA